MSRVKESAAAEQTQQRQAPEAGRGTLRTYITGFILSVALTLAAYMLVVNHSLGSLWLTAAIVALAILQLGVQLFFFLHLGRESKPRWNLTVFSFALIVVLILVFGSLWIMNNLNYNMMTPTQTDQSIIKDEGVQ
jgi:cytochrome o ubiquinol oxidase operon protein cyoD